MSGLPQVFGSAALHKRVTVIFEGGVSQQKSP